MSQLNTDPILRLESNKILFFDMDGTLIDTDFANFLAYKKSIECVIKKPLMLNFNPLLRFNRNLLNSLPYPLTENEFTEIIQKKEIFFQDYLPETKLIMDKFNILDKYFKTNKTILVTNCNKDRAIKTLDFHGLANKFCNLFFRETNIVETKFDKYRTAIEALSLSPRDIIAFENEENEIIKAIGSGIKIINPKFS